MRLALDTNAYSAAARGQERAVALVRAADKLIVPFVVLAELRCLRHGRVRRARAQDRPGAPRRQTLHVVYGTTVVVYFIGLLALAPVEIHLLVHAL